MKFRNYKSGLLALGLALALAGCGGGSSGPRDRPTTPNPPPLPPPPIPDPTLTGFDGAYKGYFAGIDQQGNTITAPANSSALGSAFTLDLTSSNNARVSTTGSIGSDGTVSTSGQGNSAFPGNVTVSGNVDPLGTGLVFMGQASGSNTQNTQNTPMSTFMGRIISINDGTDNAYGGSYTGTLNGSGGNGNFNFTLQNDGSARGDVTSFSTLSTIFDGFSQPRLIGAVTRDGVARFVAVSGKMASNGGAPGSFYIDFQGQGTIDGNTATINGFYTIGDPANGLTGTFTARRN